ncbi:hypothetical protein GBAR_LOCUS9845 [Geodia barretti]|uniref:Uncharacterized protein n=1 Tax=Geodia barretti TaxID=519541 RepID=A0AA35RQN7_GEOBA|nr:hypothetical protein GBAR_LOCUS9845 [Geodia barretti]
MKGCGCYLDKDGSRISFPAFPVQQMEGAEGKWEVRGCCFKHTAHNEQHMCDVIASVLEKEGMVVGNRSLCLWRYSIPGEPVDVVPKYCGVFETLGERRLSSDLLPGLSSLLPHLLPSLSLSSILALFPPDRVSHTANGQPSILPTWSACCTGGQHKKKEPVNLCHTPLQETPPTFTPEGLSTGLLGEWCRTVYGMKDLLPLSQELLCTHGSVLAALYWRLGWEVGVVSSTLATNGINWGYFFDHNPFEPHCNQHPNNFVILPPGHENLLAPVDFDLAFTADRFVSPYTGTNDQSLFQSWLDSGLTEMERALGGEAVNTGVLTSAKADLSPSHSALEWGLRDTLVCGYREAVSTPSRQAPPPLPPSLRKTMDSLIRLALIVSSRP